MEKLHAFMHKLHNPDLGILFIRLALGIVFIYGGWFKVTHMNMVLEGFKSFGLPAIIAYYVSYTELIGGVLLLLGIFGRYVGIVFAINMAYATFVVNFPRGFSLANFGYEYTLVLMLSSMALITMGAGKYSLAKMLKK